MCCIFIVVSTLSLSTGLSVTKDVGKCQYKILFFLRSFVRVLVTQGALIFKYLPPGEPNYLNYQK